MSYRVPEGRPRSHPAIDDLPQESTMTTNGLLHPLPMVITAEMSEEEQLAVLQECIEVGKQGVTCVLMTVTPFMASYWLSEDHHIENRQLRYDKLTQYRRFMNAGWDMTGEAIVFERGGRLINGYHRCTACVSVNKSFITLVVFGIDQSAFKILDTGGIRSVMDAFTIAGIPNPKIAADGVRWIKIYQSQDRYDRSFRWLGGNTEALAFYDAIDKEAFQGLVEDTREISQKSKDLMPKTQLIGYLYMMLQNSKHRAVMDQFLEQFRENKGAAIVAWRYLDKRRELGIRISENMRTVVLDAARDAMLRKEKLTEKMIKDGMEVLSGRDDDD